MLHSENILLFVTPGVKWVSADIITSYRHTLWRKIQAVVTPLLANLVSVIDKDCNLDLLVDEGEEMRNLWFHIFGSKEMLSVPYVKEIK